MSIYGTWDKPFQGYTVLAKRVGHGLREFQQSLRNRKEIEDRIGELPRLHTRRWAPSYFISSVLFTHLQTTHFQFEWNGLSVCASGMLASYKKDLSGGRGGDNQ